jgi:anthranilate synthase component 2
MLLLIDNYDSFTFNLYQYFEELGSRTRVVRNDAVSVADIRRLKPSHIVISPGPGTPDESGVSLGVLEELSGTVPILGVCLGHQAIGQVFGGRVIRAPQLMHGKVSELKHDGKGVFAGLPKKIEATRYHSLIVERKSLPACLVISAQTADGLIMGLRHRTLPVEGVQFHPESMKTPEGKGMLKNFLAMRAGARRAGARRR